MAELTIDQSDADEAFALAEQVPEFDAGDGALDRAEFQRRLGGRSALVLVARLDGVAAGFKAGYDRYGDGSWYSWMGGVLPEARNAGVALALLEAQEKWAMTAGFERIYVKTRNRHRAMLRLLVGQGYDLLQVDARDQVEENRLLLCKRLRSEPF